MMAATPHPPEQFTMRVAPRFTIPAVRRGGSLLGEHNDRSSSRTVVLGRFLDQARESLRRIDRHPHARAAGDLRLVRVASERASRLWPATTPPRARSAARSEKGVIEIETMGNMPYQGYDRGLDDVALEEDQARTTGFGCLQSSRCRERVPWQRRVRWSTSRAGRWHLPLQ